MITVGVQVETLVQHPAALLRLKRLLTPVNRAVFPVYEFFFRQFGSPLLLASQGDRYMLTFLEAYVGEICTSKRNVESYLRLFQELAAHSVYHLLPTIKAPTLIISGYLDVLTPPLQSVEMARRIPNSSHYCDPFSSHMSILESPEWVIAEIDAFLQGRKDDWGARGPHIRTRRGNDLAHHHAHAPNAQT